MSVPLDALQRPLRDLRVSVTDQCNFRCPYCMPAAVFGAAYRFLPAAHLMAADELREILGVFVSLGVSKLRFTGGEPLLRADLPEIIAHAKHVLRVDDVAVTTNGWFLERTAPALASAGLDRITVSLDSLDPRTFGLMNGRGWAPDRVLAGIAAARTHGLPVKLNMVVQRGVNDDGIEALAAWARVQRVTLRFIEFMDVGNHNGWAPERVVPAREIVARLHARWPLRPLVPAYRGEVAARHAYVDGAGEIGLVSSITEPFCRDCNRARLSADGKLFTCLFATSGRDVLSVWRATRSPDVLRAHLEGLWRARTDRYSEEREALRAASAATASPAPAPAAAKVEMSYIGG
ncbi:GTP 3',8-cyclase MoaA [Nibricoccus sp. IMCC34717]|uniref:GTP 3',8-cyclase MoaA n=1 Tax=Nibricoccus sp. IMCC34717 TaxID=3034021 RepID=UPI00384FDA3E